MPISRREWLRSGLLTGAVLGMPVLQRATAAAGRGETTAAAEDGALLTRSTLLRELNTRFVVWRPLARPVGLRLVQVTDPTVASATAATTAGIAGDENCFSAFFEGSSYAPLEQGTYTLSHPTLGRLNLFLVPVGRPGRVRTYELAVNRIAA